LTPDQLTAFGSVIERFGLPLAMLALFFWAFVVKRWIVTKGELDDKAAELDKMTALYERERTDRLTAEQTLLRGTGTSADVAQAVAELSETVIARLPSLYDERLQGVRRRAGR
jgi:hypothetical protein